MIRNARTAVKFFVYGVIVGLMFAPQSGSQTRQKFFGWIGETVQDTVSTVTGGGNSNA
ncbi:MAG: YtxH domain-containing protein [Chloroflexia bacterium]|jgi:gas vesicle protein|nr:YtxH domain-containing protein [Chloroflexia bacterium]MDQ3612786.1 YtxH domain-containing protein [Chloroflexota bacterium]